MAFNPRIIDSFDRADAPNLGTCSVEGAWVGSLWDAADGLRIISNQAATDATAGGNAMHNIDYGPDVQVAVTQAVNDYEWFGLWARMNNVNGIHFNGYYLKREGDGQTWRIYRIVDTVETEVGSSVTGIFGDGAGDKIGLEVLGTGATVTFNFYLDTGSGWVLKNTWSDTDAARILTAGKVGLGAAATGTGYRWDDFRAQTSASELSVAFLSGIGW